MLICSDEHVSCEIEHICRHFHITLWSPSSPPFHPPSLSLSLPPSLPFSLLPFTSPLLAPSLPFPLLLHLRVSQLAFFVFQWSRLLTYSRSHLVCIKEWSPTPPSRREEQAVEHHQDTKVCTSMYYCRSVQVSLSLILSLSPLLLCLSSLPPYILHPLSLPPSLTPSLHTSPSLTLLSTPTAATQYPSNGAVGGRGLEESDDYVDNQGGTLQFDDQYQGEYECE